ncbi:heme lyase CcmF/NrfE family subunit [Bryobacter aggregatus]|uniref:heme lyase CcmF/NrfE family subunit n=1 Tax=Bryobacter aggregatus TaxID=360054 RepID=UPI00068FB691|nr:heme lyase CcmF/NrfE family subunit [Bryobacter aggregatus]
MENVGALALLLAFSVAIFALFSAVVGALRKNLYLIAASRRAVYVVWALITTASGILLYALITGDYRLQYVAGHANTAMPLLYKISAWWGGQEGSLLFWSWILSSYTVAVVFTNRKQFKTMMPWVIAIMSATQVFFLILNNFVVPPFTLWAIGRGIINLPDGQGLNPLLQTPSMAIHPPMLYLGYVGFIVPFAFAIGSLITKQPGDEWIHTTRRWTLITWLFQTIGITLGMGWAYYVLGWGGYWGWDPVENASVLPWITATAFLHSVMMQEKKGMMKVWNMVLVSATFFLCIFGTMLTRSGLVQSVHAFGISSIGNYFAVFLAIGIAGTVWLILDRLDFLKSESHLESVVSRESSFLFNNLVLLASCFAVLWGTLFPVISEAITGEKISVDAPFFNRVNIPIGLFLIFLTGVGPLVAWRRSSLDSLKRNFLWPTVSMFILMAALFGAGIRSAYALISFGLCLFVTVTIGSEFVKGAFAIAQKESMNLVRAVIELTHRNTRRYGGYIVHMGIVVMFVGFTGAAFNKDVTVEAAMGKSFQIGRYDITVTGLTDGENDNYAWMKAAVDVSVDGKKIDTMNPERRIYKASRQPASLVDIRRRLNEDLFLNFAAMASEGQGAIIQAYVFPLVSWIWVGFWVVLIGTLICLVPAKIKLSYARTQVLGSSATSLPTEEHAKT